MPELTHLSLFSGIGGLDLAAEWAGFRTVGQCEWADYPRAVLEKNWPGLPKWRDIRTLTKESFYEETGLESITVLSGGFPCQPFSQAGKRRGAEDDRYLWPEMLRVIQELRPTWVVGENVAGIVTLALDTVLSDLEAIGYTSQAVIIPACAVDAHHRRDRCAILAHTSSIGLQTERPKQQAARTPGKSEALADSNSERLQGMQFCGTHTEGTKQRRAWAHGTTSKCCDDGRPGTPSVWKPEPNVGRVAHGVPNRVDRIKCLGNAVVPQQFFPIFNAIAELEAMNEHSAKC